MNNIILNLLCSFLHNHINSIMYIVYPRNFETISHLLGIYEICGWTNKDVVKITSEWRARGTYTARI